MPKDGKRRPRNDKRASTGARVTLGASLENTSAVELHASLVRAGAEDSPVTVEGNGVTRVETAPLQVLAAFAQSLGGAERAFTWIDPSPVLLDGARLLGLAADLGLEPHGGTG
jgi:anti-anti-sigma regulatory factor